MALMLLNGTRLKTCALKLGMTQKHSSLTSIGCKLQVQCKIALQKELGLPIRPDCPLVRC